MPRVEDLLGLRRARCRPAGRRHPAGTAEDGDAWVRPEPRGERLGRAVGQEVDWPMALKSTSRVPNAWSRDLWCNRVQEFAVVIGAEPLFRFRACQLTGGFGDGALAMHPCRFNAIAPGTLARQLADHQATATGALDPLVMALDPGPYGAAHRPGGVVPDRSRAPVCRRRPPGQPATREHGVVTRLTGRPSTKRSSMAWVSARSHAIAGERFGLGIMPVRRVLDHAQGGTVCPGLPVGVGQAAPPDVIGAPSHPWLGERGPVVSGDPGPFLSSLRRIRTRDPVRGALPGCAKALERPTDGLIAERRAVRPCSWLTWAASASVHTPVGWPTVRGD